MKKLITICAVVTMILAATGVAQAGSYADLTGRANYKASTGLTLGAEGTGYGGVTGYVMAAEFQINLLYQAGVADTAIDAFNDYWIPNESTYNFPDHEDYYLAIDGSGNLPVYTYGTGAVPGDTGPDIQWTLTGWEQTVLCGDIVDQGDGTLFLRVIPEATYRPFPNDPPVNDVEIFDGDMDCEVLGYTFTGAIGDIDDGSTFGVTLTPEPTTMTLLALGGLALLKRKRKS